MRISATVIASGFSSHDNNGPIANVASTQRGKNVVHLPIMTKYFSRRAGLQFSEIVFFESRSNSIPKFLVNNPDVWSLDDYPVRPRHINRLLGPIALLYNFCLSALNDTAVAFVIENLYNSSVPPRRTLNQILFQLTGLMVYRRA